MYSGETIELEELWDNQKYDIDHIFPQSKVMDDSLDNRVLVKKKCNQMKEDKYPIDETVRKKMQPFWKSLVDAGLISEEKYKRLNLFPGSWWKLVRVQKRQQVFCSR